MTKDKRKWILQVMASIYLCFAAPASSEVPIYRNMPELDRAKILSEAGQDFEFDQAGLLVDGPRRGPAEPIDYSAISTDDFLLKGFIDSVFGCREGAMYCSTKFFRIDGHKINIRIKSSSGKQSSHHRLFEAAFENTLGKFGFRQVESSEKSVSEIVIEIGNDRQLLEKAQQLEDDYGVEFFESKTSAVPSAQADVSMLQSCYLSTKRRAQGKQVILINPNVLEPCLPRLLLASIGLYETFKVYPSITSINREYRVATVADQTFFLALYSSEFPINGGLTEVRNFYLHQLNENSAIKRMLKTD